MALRKTANVQFGSILQADGKIVVGAIENEKVIAQHAFDQNGAVAFGAHLLNNAKAAQKKPLTTQVQSDGVVYDVTPGAISIADAEGGKRLQVILWFGESGIGFPMEPEMAKQLFGAVIAASAKGAKH
jgi:hypothetical protein